ncbi:MAG: secretin N-terminal domain-containing protein [Arcobacter sp.]|uniref:secretin N-terminal domain-containing protein n=1 Tax=unclassified Arcobacter TaxID=2593671 RepID=UPI000229626F|nr:secretin N-terminal domain-containing protein [Arcobacter sp. L]BAK74205.1 type II secretion system protein D [Arcobacter sp. L]
MRLINKILVVSLIVLQLNGADDKVNINFKDLKVMDLIKITSKIIDKNILITEDIKGNVDFVSNKPVNKDELIKILGYVLEDKGYSLVQTDEILRIVKLNESANSNVPIANNNSSNDLYWMVTEVFTVKDADVDYVASKIRHLISKDAKMVTNKDSNALVITDFKDNIDTVKEVVKIMTSGANKNSVIVELKNIDASEAKKNLDAIAKSKFNEKVETQKVSVVENKDNNSVVIIGEAGNINYLARYIKNVDEGSSLIKREVKVFSLKNVEAINVIKILDSVVGKKTYSDPNRKPLISADEETNTIIVMGPADELEYIQTLMDELDKEKAQVYVQARIIEVNDELVNNIGVQYGIFGGTAGSNGLATFSSSLNGGSDSISLVKEAIGLDIPDIKSGLALGASLNLLKQNGALDVVSEPSILAVNNKESSIYVGEKISVETSSSVTDGGTERTNYQREDVGLTLKVKPRISSESKVTLEINALLEGIKSTKVSAGQNPDTLKKEIKTTAILNNGESVIIGGLIENKSESTVQKVPVLGDIPLFGNLFTNDSTTTKKNNLVVIVTPYMIPKAKDITYVRNQLAELKGMEDRYLEDSLIRLKEEAIKKKVETKHREEKIKELNEQLKDLNNEKIIQTSDDKTEHEKRVKEILGQ